MEERRHLGMEDILGLLRSRGIAFEEAHHPPVFTIEEMLEQDLPHPELIAKNLFLRDDKKRRYYLVVAREDQRVDLKALRTVIGSRPLSMASEEDLMSHLGLTRGSVTPFGILNDPDRSVDVVVDSSFRGSRMGVHPNDNTCTVWVGTEDLESLISDGCASFAFADLPTSDRWVHRHSYLGSPQSRFMQKSRAERLMENVEGMDAVVIANDGEPFLDSAFWYLTEQTSGTFEGSFAIAGPGGKLDVIVSILEEEGARQGAGDVHVYHTGKERDEFIREALKGCTKVGFNVNNATYAAVEYVKKVAEGIEVVNASDAIGDTVSVKDEKEIAATREACRISSIVAGEIPDMLSEGVTEKQVAARMDNRMRELGGTGNAFDTIAAFGPWSSQPHHMPCDYSLKRGDTALFDFGTKYDRYCSDMTRTVFLGRPPEVLERAYEVVLEAQRAGIEAYRAGIKAFEPDLAARKVIDESEFKGKFIHSFGHGIGMDVHQHISVSPRSEQILKAGNIVSAEPGVYIPGVGGIRIEDTILVTEDGCEVLTSFDHSFTVV